MPRTNIELEQRVFATRNPLQRQRTSEQQHEENTRIASELERRWAARENANRARRNDNVRSSET